MSSLTSTMIVLFGVIIIGYIGGKIKVMDGKANKIVSNIMLNITAPFLIISSVSTSSTEEIPVNIFFVMMIGVIFYAVLMILSRIYVKLMPLNEFEKPVYEVGMAFGNVSFLGYPIFAALLGQSAIFVSTILNLPFNILMFSYGIYLFTKDNKENKIDLKTVINPAFIASILALVIYLLKIQIPMVLGEVFSSVGGITIPLSMLLIGSSLAEVDLKYLFEDIKVYVYSLVKLIILPVIVFFITKALNFDPYLIKMITLNVGFPAASMIVMLATQYNKSIRSASIAVFVSTLLSVITLPLIEKFLFELI